MREATRLSLESYLVDLQRLSTDFATEQQQLVQAAAGSLVSSSRSLPSLSLILVQQKPVPAPAPAPELQLEDFHVVDEANAVPVYVVQVERRKTT